MRVVSYFEPTDDTWEDRYISWQESTGASNEQVIEFFTKRAEDSYKNLEDTKAKRRTGNAIMVVSNLGGQQIKPVLEDILTNPEHPEYLQSIAAMVRLDHYDLNGFAKSVIENSTNDDSGEMMRDNVYAGLAYRSRFIEITPEHEAKIFDFLIERRNEENVPWLKIATDQYLAYNWSEYKTSQERVNFLKSIAGLDENSLQYANRRLSEMGITFEPETMEQVEIIQEVEAPTSKPISEAPLVIEEAPTLTDSDSETSPWWPWVLVGLIILVGLVWLISRKRGQSN